MKVKVSTVHSVLIYLLVFFSTKYINYNPIKYLAIVAVALMILPYVKVLFLRRNSSYNIGMVAFCVAVLAVSYAKRNGYSERNPFFASIVFLSVLVEFAMTIEIFSYKGRMQELLRVFYWMTLGSVIATDLLILFTNIHLRYGGDTYLIGTKFSVIYTHFYLIVFYVAVKKIELQSMTKKLAMNKVILVLYLAIAMVIAIKVETVTGTVGTVALAVLLWLCDTHIEFFLNAKTFLIAVLLSVLFAVFVDVIFSNEVVAYFITRVLGKDITMTYRTEIYVMFPQIMENHWLWGFGYGTGYEVLMKYGIIDAQNGIYYWIQQIGILGTLIFTYWLSIAMKKPVAEFDIRDGSIKALTALVYLFALLATVEITYSTKFIAIVTLLYGTKLQYVQEQMLE